MPAMLADLDPAWLNVVMNGVQVATMIVAGIGLALGYRWHNGWARSHAERRKGGDRRRRDSVAKRKRPARKNPAGRSRRDGKGK